MARGIFRIIAGIAMIILQLLMISFFWTQDFAMLSNVFFYLYGVVGVMLLIFGMRAYMTEYSQLILHTNHKGIHTFTKRVAVALSLFLFVFYTARMISLESANIIFYILMILSTLSFAIYSLAYMYRKPSCLFSTALILLALFYFFSTITYLVYTDNSTQYLLLQIVPRLIIGVLYIVIATKLYKENHSVNVIKVLGWIAFGLELISRIPEILVLASFNLYNFCSIVELGYIVILWLYLSVFKINTLRAPVAVEMVNTIKFCRKCGKKLAEGSRYCHECGTRIIMEMDT